MGKTNKQKVKELEVQVVHLQQEIARLHESMDSFATWNVCPKCQHFYAENVCAFCGGNDGTEK